MSHWIANDVTRCRWLVGERISHVTDMVKQMVLDVAELHDFHHRRQQSRNQVPAEPQAGLSLQQSDVIDDVTWTSGLDRVLARRTRQLPDIT